MRASIVATVVATGAFLALAGGGVALAGAKTGGGGVPGGNGVSVPVAVPIDNCGDGSAPLEVAHAGCSGGVKAAGVSWERAMSSERLVSKASLEGCLSSVSCQHSMAEAILERASVRSAGRAFLERCLSSVSCERAMAEAIWDRSTTKTSWKRSTNGVSLESSMSRVSLAGRVTGVSLEGSTVGVSWHSELLSRTVEIRISNNISDPCQCLGRVPHVGVPHVLPVIPLGQQAVTPFSQHAQHLQHMQHVNHVSPHAPLQHSGPIATATTAPVSGSADTPIRDMLPITGVNLEGLMGSAFGLLATGIGALFGAARAGGRRRPRGPA